MTKFATSMPYQGKNYLPPDQRKPKAGFPPAAPGQPAHQFQAIDPAQPHNPPPQQAPNPHAQQANYQQRQQNYYQQQGQNQGGFPQQQQLFVQSLQGQWQQRGQQNQPQKQLTPEEKLQQNKQAYEFPNRTVSHISFNKRGRHEMCAAAGGNYIYIIDPESQTQVPAFTWVLSRVNPENIPIFIMDILFEKDLLFVATNFGVYCADFNKAKREEKEVIVNGIKTKPYNFDKVGEGDQSVFKSIFRSEKVCRNLCFERDRLAFIEGDMYFDQHWRQDECRIVQADVIVDDLRFINLQPFDEVTAGGYVESLCLTNEQRVVFVLNGDEEKTKQGFQKQLVVLEMHEDHQQVKSSWCFDLNIQDVTYDLMRCTFENANNIHLVLSSFQAMMYSIHLSPNAINIQPLIINNTIQNYTQQYKQTYSINNLIKTNENGVQAVCSSGNIYHFSFASRDGETQSNPPVEIWNIKQYGQNLIGADIDQGGNIVVCRGMDNEKQNEKCYLIFEKPKMNRVIGQALRTVQLDNGRAE